MMPAAKMTPAWNPPPGPRSPCAWTYSANSGMNGTIHLLTTRRIVSRVISRLLSFPGAHPARPPTKQEQHADARGEDHGGLAQRVVAAVAGQHHRHHVADLGLRGRPLDVTGRGIALGGGVRVAVMRHVHGALHHR